MSWWSQYSPEAFERTQSEILSKSGAEVIVKRVRISENLQMFTLRVGCPQKPPLVMFHGFGSSGILFFKLFKPLSEHYHLIVVDLLGMGLSSRPPFSSHTLEDSEQFFLGSFEAFREAEQLGPFVLAGHSFGGYLAGCYATQYPQHVSSLVFISAVGVPTMPSEYNYFTELSGKSWKERWLFKAIVYLWVRDVTPMAVIRRFGYFSSFGIRKYCKHRVELTDPEEHRLIEEYYTQMLLLPESGELALSNILRPGGWAVDPLCKRMSGLEIPMAFYFGDRDWVNTGGVDVLKKNNRTRVTMKTITQSDHFIFFDNPEELAKEILADLLILGIN